ncbi:MAG: T9SS type A sorting domain-containing protein [Bacteroidota bacterium]
MKAFNSLVFTIICIITFTVSIDAQNQLKSSKGRFIADSVVNNYSYKAKKGNYKTATKQTKPILRQSVEAISSVQVDPCLEFEGGPYLNFNGFNCYPDCENATVGNFEVWANEAYLFSGLTPGAEYTFEFCNGYDPVNNWEANITIAERVSNTPTNSVITVSGCSATFIAPASGEAMAIIFDVCGNPELQVDNGIPTFRCTGNGSTLPLECCNDIIPLDCGDMVTGNTADGQDVFEQYEMATGYTGPELIYEFEVDPGRLEIDLTNLNSNLDLFLIAVCEDPINSQDFASTNTGTADERIAGTVIASTTFYIVIDGLQGATSTFDLSISCASPCTDSLAVNRRPIAEANYRAANVISSVGRAESGTTINFAAGNTIRLLEGFIAESGTTFTAAIEECTVSNSTFIEARNEDVPISTIPEQYELRVFPNPFEGQTNIQFYLSEARAANIFITDLNGKVRYQQQMNSVQSGWQQLRLDASDWNSGMYLLFIRTDETQVVQQLVVQQ